MTSAIRTSCLACSLLTVLVASAHAEPFEARSFAAASRELSETGLFDHAGTPAPELAHGILPLTFGDVSEERHDGPTFASISDHGRWRGEWGHRGWEDGWGHLNHQGYGVPGGTGSAPVPEPSPVLSLALGLLALVGLRRTHRSA